MGLVYIYHDVMQAHNLKVKLNYVNNEAWKEIKIKIDEQIKRVLFGNAKKLIKYV